jgi:peptide/nickel transport system permease protein
MDLQAPLGPTPRWLLRACRAAIVAGPVVRFVVKRLALGVVVLAALSCGSFLFFASQLDPYRGHPLLPAYWRWLKGLESGASLHPLAGGEPWNGLGHTAVLLLAAFVLVVVFGSAFAVAAARWHGSPIDVVLRGGSYLAWAVPAFLLALLLQLALNTVGSSHGVGPFPVAGWPGRCPPGIGINYGTISPCPAAGSGLRYVLNVLRYMTFPSVTLALGFVGLHGRYLRSALLETLGAPFVVTARAKGLSERRVLLRHALRASLATFAAALLSDFGAIFGTALAVDWIFQLDGLGTIFIDLFPTQSYAMINLYAVQLVLLLTASIVIVSSLLGELAVGSLDPRAGGER